jgi:Nucleotidyl transferase AbiEii toxin, Type IV TA system
VVKRFDPRLDVLPDAQKEIWAGLSPAPRLSFVLYGGTAIALQLGHRQSIDFDFFRAGPLHKQEIREAFQFLENAPVLQDTPDTLIVLAEMPSGAVKVSFLAASDSDGLMSRFKLAMARCSLHRSMI